MDKDNTEKPPKKNRLDNLRPPWKPGECGNPHSKNIRKGYKQRGTILREIADLDVKKIPQFAKMAKGLPKGTTIEDLINLALVKQAAKGKIDAIKEVQDTLYGKIKDVKEISGPDGGAIPVIIDDISE